MEKRVFADRAEYLGDPDYVDVPMQQLLSEEYIQGRAREVDPQEISTVDGVAPGLESHDTTHYSILDGWGNAVSNTYTINWDFGSGVIVEGAGFLLNNEMDDFSVKPGVPNVYGVVGNTANEIQPGKRMLSSMTRTRPLPAAAITVFAIPPPKINSSTFSASARNTSSFVETFAPPMIAVTGRSGCSSAADNASSSATSNGPAHANGAYRATACVLA